MKLPQLAAAWFACLLAAPGALAAPATPAKPNLVIILADDLGLHDVGCYGSEIPTPQIDRLARRGVKLQQYYAAAPVCTPSRFGLLTGRYPGRSQDKLLGALMFAEARDDHRGIRPGEITLAEVLRQNGYHTALIGKWHLGHGEPGFTPLQHGFDYFYGMNGGCVDYFTLRYGDLPDWIRDGKQVQERGYSTDLLARDAVRYLKSRPAGQPFFLYLAFNAPHYGKGWDAAEKKRTNILQAKPEDRAALAAIQNSDRREYAAMVTALDRGVGEVLDALRAERLEDNTLVVFASDNGGDPKYGGDNQPFRGSKNQVFEGGIRVPCLVQWPPKIKAGTASAQAACGIDFFATFCRVAGIPTKGFHLDGVDLAPALFDGNPFERELCWTLPRSAAFRRGSWKYVQSPQGELLFNLDSDAVEQHDLARAEPAKLKELKGAYEALAAGFEQGGDGTRRPQAGW
jgi:arylsulfatase A-like enzyme